MEPRASHEPTAVLVVEGPRDPQCGLQSSAPVPPHQQAKEGPRDGNAGFLVAQEDVNQAMNRAADAHLEPEAAFGRAAQAERTTSETRQSNRELLERVRVLELQVLGRVHTASQPRPMPSARQARREGRSTYGLLEPASDPSREA
ncbi:unnamed protein product [Peronospora farinosa]|nr:unnamed protein product [Peronospora farinosa]